MIQIIKPNPPAAGESPIPREGVPALAPRIAAYVANRIDEHLAGRAVRLIHKPMPGPKIKQVYRVEKMLWPEGPIQEHQTEQLNKIADDLAGQLVSALNRHPGCELVSWAGEIPHSVHNADAHNGSHVAVRVLAQYHPDSDRFLVRFDVIYRALKLPEPKVPHDSHQEIPPQLAA